MKTKQVIAGYIGSVLLTITLIAFAIYGLASAGDGDVAITDGTTTTTTSTTNNTTASEEVAIADGTTTTTTSTASQQTHQCSIKRGFRVLFSQLVTVCLDLDDGFIYVGIDHYSGEPGIWFTLAEWNNFLRHLNLIKIVISDFQKT